MLVKLPDAIAVEILSQWLKLQDVGKVDSAHCSNSNKIRDDFLFMLTTASFPEASDSIKLKISGFNWVVLRKIKLCSLSLNFDYFQLHYNKLYNYFSEAIFIRSLEIKRNLGCSSSEDFALKLINSCDNLRKLLIDDYTDHILSIRPAILNQLTHLTFHRYNAPPIDSVAESFQVLIKQCRSLEEISSSYFFSNYEYIYLVGISQNTYIELLKSNPNMLYINDLYLFDADNTLLNAIAQYCPKIKTINNVTVKSDGDFSILCVADVFTKCKELTSLGVVVEYEPGNDLFGSIELKGSSGAICNPSSVDKACLSTDYIESKTVAFRSIKFVDGVMDEFFKKIVGFTAISIESNFADPVSDDTIRLIGSNNPHLEHFVLRDCEVSFTPHVFASFLQKCTRLHTLEYEVYTDYETMDKKLRVMFSVPTNITKLNLSNMPMSFDTVMHILNTSTKIKHLCIAGCKRIDDPRQKIVALLRSRRGGVYCVEGRVEVFAEDVENAYLYNIPSDPDDCGF